MHNSNSHEMGKNYYPPLTQGIQVELEQLVDLQNQCHSRKSEIECKL